MVPLAPLDHHIAHFWSLAWHLDAPEVAETLPHPTVHVVIEGDRFEVSGVHTARFTRTLQGDGRVFGIKFRPAMFHGFFKKPVNALANRVVPISAVFGRKGTAFAKSLSALEDDDERITVAEAFFLERLSPSDAQADQLRDLVEQIAIDRTMINVDLLSQRSGVSTRTLQRLFGLYVGVNPKWVVQRYRLLEAAERLAVPGTSAAELAAELGYTDQPHFVRDFKAVVGRTPGEYARLT